MSRSYRRTPVVKDMGRRKRIEKRFANKRVRNTGALSSGADYKRVYCSWNICDWRTRWTMNDALELWSRMLERFGVRQSLSAARAEYLRKYFWK